MEVLATCHVHSKWSYDGSWSLEALSAKFGQRGSRVLMMTEHDRGFTSAKFVEFREICAQVSSEDVLVVPGIEYSDATNTVHVLVWGPVPFLGEGLPTGKMLDGVQKAGGVAVLAHPSRRQAWKLFDPSWCGKLLGIEAWNRKYDGWAPGKDAPALIQKAGAVPFVGLDFHTQRQSFSLAMALDLDGPLTEASVIDCLKARHCSARAFGLPLDEGVIAGALPVFNVAEQGRRKLRDFAKSSGLRSTEKRVPKTS
jgi:hypothetical protein